MSNRIELINKSLKWHLKRFSELKSTPMEYLDKSTIQTTIKYHQDLVIILQMLADQFFEKEKIANPQLVLSLKGLWGAYQDALMPMKGIVDYLDLKVRVANYDNVIEVDFKDRLHPDRRI